MNIGVGGSGRVRGSAPLVLIDAQALIESYGHAALRQARQRQGRQGDMLGRDADHWRHVADVLCGSDVLHRHDTGDGA